MILALWHGLLSCLKYTYSVHRLTLLKQDGAVLLLSIPNSEPAIWTLEQKLKLMRADNLLLLSFHKPVWTVASVSFPSWQEWGPDFCGCSPSPLRFACSEMLVCIFFSLVMLFHLKVSGPSLPSVCIYVPKCIKLLPWDCLIKSDNLWPPHFLQSVK